MNKKYILAKSALIFFSLTTVMIFSLMRQPGRMRAMGITPDFATILVLANFALLIASVVFFVWQRAHKDTPAHQAVETLEAFAVRELHESIALPEAISIPDNSLKKLSTPDEAVSLSPQGYLSSKYIRVGQTIKLTSTAEPKQYVIATVVTVSDDVIELRSIN